MAVSRWTATKKGRIGANERGIEICAEHIYRVSSVEIVNHLK